MSPVIFAFEAVICPPAFNLNPVSPLALLDLISVAFRVNPPMLPILELTVPLTCKVVPSNDKLEFPSTPPNANVPSFKSIIEPTDELSKLFEVILPV